MPRRAGGGQLELIDCAVRFQTPNLGTAGYQGVTKRIGAVGNRLLRRTSHEDNANVHGGVPDNQLVYPSFNPTNGSNVAAMPPWNHTGAGATFKYLWQPAGYPGISSGRQARHVEFLGQSGVSQAILGINMAKNVPVYYQAMANLPSGSATYRFALEDALGNVYDEWIYTSVGNAAPQLITLMAVPEGADGNPVLVIENKSDGKAELDMHWQLVSTNPNAAFVEPPDGLTKTMTGYWSANVDSLRAYGRLALPHKSDDTGSGFAGLKDVESDIYLSNQSERLKYYATPGAATVRGYTSGNILTVTKVISGALAVGQLIDVPGIAGGTTITTVNGGQTYGIASAMAVGNAGQPVTISTFGRWFEVAREVQVSAAPQSGFFMKGDFARNTSPAVVNGKVLFGWSRLTTGDKHVALPNQATPQDWTPLYMTTA